MGSSLSCLCPSENTVLLIKPNGKVMKLKAGTRVKEIRAAYPRHFIVLKNGGLSSILPDTFQLGGEEVYSLVEDGKQETLSLKTLMNLAQIRDRGTTRPRAKVNAVDDGDLNKDKVPCNEDRSLGGDKDGVPSQVLLLRDASSEYRKPTWMPALHTIPEIHSPEIL